MQPAAHDAPALQQLLSAALLARPMGSSTTDNWRCLVKAVMLRHYYALILIPAIQTSSTKGDERCRTAALVLLRRSPTEDSAKEAITDHATAVIFCEM
jgi:hypothetical protein